METFVGWTPDTQGLASAGLLPRLAARPATLLGGKQGGKAWPSGVPDRRGRPQEVNMPHQ